MLRLPSIPYPPAGDGVWGPVTSTLNWCEEDYYATIYSAEIVNTLTNLSLVYLGYLGILNCLRNGHPRVFLVAFISYTAIGVTSFWFHNTLKYTMQLFDELSMIYTQCVLFYAVFSFGQSKPYRVLLAIFLVGLALFITGYYHYLGDPLFHQNAFALLTTTVVLRSIYVMEKKLRPSGRKIDPLVSKSSSRPSAVPTDRDARIERRDQEALKTMRLLWAIGVGSVGLGFLIWNLDNIYCSALRQWRRNIGLPWGILLEGHGWWHLWTGLAGYFHVVSTIWLRYCLEGKHDSVTLVWPSLFTSVPAVERISSKVESKQNSPKSV